MSTCEDVRRRRLRRSFLYPNVIKTFITNGTFRQNMKTNSILRIY